MPTTLVCDIAKLQMRTDINVALISMLATSTLRGWISIRKHGRFEIHAAKWSLGMVSVSRFSCDGAVNWVCEVPFSNSDSVALVIQRAKLRMKDNEASNPSNQ